VKCRKLGVIRHINILPSDSASNIAGEMGSYIYPERKTTVETDALA
jgi:hypothetical protein